jgi:hypothetical protein
VLQRDVRLHGFELDGEAERIPQRAVGVGEGPEQVLVLPVGAGDDDLAVAGEDLGLEDRLVGRPDRNDDASMPRPVTAPPSVIVRSCGTTSGMRPWGSVAATRSS